MPTPHVITLYGKPDKECRGCKFTKLRLKEKGADYRFVDLTKPEHADDLAAVQSLGIKSVPYVVTSDGEWTGFNPDKIDDAAAKQQRSKLAAVA